ncbi:MAG: molybdopterin-dependent oxidoreductase [Chloroflexi bacterium]|nr:molybdopterin-dependent oxidoreductase [Chloroflexota bacterium]
MRAWLAALVVGCVASGVAMLLQDALRTTWQIRGLPERIEEWLLLFVPLDLFEQGLARFGADAKELALTGTEIGMAVVLSVVGAIAIHAGWRAWRLLGLGVGLWLLTMVVVMPVTGAGLFATGLLVAPTLTDSGYLLVFLAYATVLVLGQLVLSRVPHAEPEPISAERRALIVGLAGAAIAGGVATLVGRQGGLVASSLPLAVASTPTPAAAVPAAATQAPVAAEAPAPANSTPQPTPTLAPTPVPLPNPPVGKPLVRDQDGSLTAAGRPNGTLSPPVTANEDFYVVTKNAVADPVVDANTWRLVIDGEVNNPVQLDYRTLVALPAVDITKTLECISNFTAACNLTSFGCDLLSTARFRGARLSDVLDLAGGLKSTAVGLAVLSIDEFSAGLSTDVVQDPETLIVYQMNDEPLPRQHGFPARLLVPGRYGMKNPKWLAGIRAMDQAYAGWYEQRGWNPVGIVKTMSRIDTPADGATLSPGDQQVAGIAYAGDRGVMLVEISLDNGKSWQPTTFLEPMQDTDSMVRWQTTFSMPRSGSLSLTVRATDGRGQVQTDEFQLPQPNGATGQDMITVNAG